MRNYIVASWNDADQYDYSGEMLGGSRHAVRSQKVHFNPDGSACVASYGDPEPNKKPKISVADKILPQQKRVITLTNQMRELVADYKAGLYTIEEYSLLLDVLTAKKERAEELLRKARMLKPKSAQDSAEHSPLSTSPIESKKHVQIATNRVNKACNSALKDGMILITGSLALLVLVKVIF